MLEFGAWLKSLRMERGLSQRQLAAKAGVSNTYISDVERSFKAKPSGPVLERFADALDVTVDYLLQRREKPEADFTSKTYPGLTAEERASLVAAVRKARGDDNAVHNVLNYMSNRAIILMTEEEAQRVIRTGRNGS